MTISEQDLRELLRERSDVVPSSHDRVDAVKQRVRRQRRRETAAVGIGLAVVLVASAGLVVPRLGAPGPTDAPATSISPTVSHEPVALVNGAATIHGIAMATTGPASIAGDAPFTVTVVATNTTSKPWTGTVSVGLLRPAPIRGGGDSLLFPPAGTLATSAFGVMLPDEVSLLDGVQGPKLSLAPRESRTLAFTVARALGTAADGPLRGWVPWLFDAGSKDGEHWPDGSAFPVVTVTPAGSTASCASLQVSGASPTPGALVLSAASTTTTTSTRVARWSAVRGLPGDLSPTVDGTVVDVITVANGLAAYGAVDASVAGSHYPDLPARTETAGTFVTYAGFRTLDVPFTGTCAPSGEGIAGVFHTFTTNTTGLLDCSVAPPVDGLGHLAARYCPVGSRARTASGSR